MDDVTTSIQVTREHAAVMLGAIRAQQILAREFPAMYQDRDTQRLASAQIILDSALERIGWMERRQWHSDIRDRLAANTAYPQDAA